MSDKIMDKIYDSEYMNDIYYEKYMEDDEEERDDNCYDKCYDKEYLENTSKQDDIEDYEEGKYNSIDIKQEIEDDLNIKREIDMHFKDIDSK